MFSTYIARNDVTFHVADAEYIMSELKITATQMYDRYVKDGTFKPISDTSDLYITTQYNGQDMSTFTYDATFYSVDFALPISFWHSVDNWRDFVMVYDRNTGIGRICNLIADFNSLIRYLTCLDMGLDNWRKYNRV